MRAACSTAGSLIATGATSSGVRIGWRAGKLRTRGEQPIGILVMSSRCRSWELIGQLAPSR